MTVETRDVKNEIINSIKALLVEVIGEEELEIVGFCMDRVFYTDLMIDSISFVYLAEGINKLYGDRVNIIDWLSKKTPRQFLAITVGELVGFIAEGLSDK